MKFSVGTDIVEVNRIEKAIEKEKSFLNRIYTEKEIQYCKSKKNQKFQSYAARFAAKEAIYKAISGNIKEFRWTHFEVVNDESGKPRVSLKLDVEGLKTIEISLSHCKEYATAYVIAVFE